MIAGYVFGYGSLLDPVSMAATLFGDHAVRCGPIPAELTGYRRVWNVAVPSGPGHRRPMRHADRTPYLHDVACLGIELAQGTACHGAVYGVTERALTLLDEREQRYDRVDVTAAVTAALPEPPERPRRLGLAGVVPGPLPVWTYVPKPHVPVRFAQQLQAGRVVVATSYLRTVERGMRLLGEQALVGYLAEPAPQCPTADLIPAVASEWDEPDSAWLPWTAEGSA